MRVNYSCKIPTPSGLNNTEMQPTCDTLQQRGRRLESGRERTGPFRVNGRTRPLPVMRRPAARSNAAQSPGKQPRKRLVNFETLELEIEPDTAQPKARRPPRHPPNKR